MPMDMSDIWPILLGSVIGQVVVGTIFMIGFVAVVRRSIDKDIPARLQSIDTHIAQLATELLSMRREVDKHSHKIETLEKQEDRRQELESRRSGDDPDDSGIRNRRTPARR